MSPRPSYPYDPRRGKRFVRPKRAMPGYVPRRGEIERRRVLPQIPLARSGIQLHENGEVILPHVIRDKVTGKLRISSHTRHKTIGQAIQHIRDQAAGMKREGFLLNAIHRQFTGMQADVVTEWKNFNAVQRENMVRLTQTYAGIIRREADLDKEHKDKAVKRLARVVELFEQGNEGAAGVGLIGVANDLIAHGNKLRRMRSEYLPRKEQLLATVAIVHGGRLEEYVKDTLKHLDLLRKGMTRPQYDAMLDKMEYDYHHLAEKVEGELKGPARKILWAAGQAIKAKNFPEGHRLLRDFNRTVIQALSRRYRISADVLSVVRDSSFSEHRRVVFSEQLEMLADETSEWYAQLGTKAPAVVSAHLHVFAEACRRDFPQRVWSNVRWAADAARAGETKIMKNRLQTATKALYESRGWV